ncbi:hypothetical protein LX16_2733 [Stackebrandtia albiflava]|uniref:Uncharacterized protein n=1 Tax=Stackebrandtia albiflava TaxID=406432 RepID=A0A562V289_9ACTN|nr:hypothetical protein [Stackebrandtia albiflava]TWJ11988.1 hypothetical protein LX16_2733 [Stackebrandtia albiflava]
MYGWIWRKLPFGLPGKLVGSVLLVTGVVALLWYVAFPNLAPLLPFGQVTVDDDGGGGGDGDGGGDDPGRVPSYDPSDFELEESPTDSASSEG